MFLDCTQAKVERGIEQGSHWESNPGHWRAASALTTELRPLTTWVWFPVTSPFFSTFQISPCIV